ncbi:ribonuclease III [Pelolinea submarina]|jgi:ribonuclease-3|uniref:Ribonuclease 3 n=1 Tax=Pelolinea submarina TaxID=913107 RepID=A0A347ZSX4_9CHLR|nr:ribonuclease III [Pelolinea submarina]REG11020.1 RNAse III [Pelolinea submarina]BBB48405.1 ribonuclease III [Pelolinea submarina]
MNDEAIIETTQELMNRLHLYFNDELLLARAMTHRSYLNEHPEALEDNERLEFLGDAVLDFLVGEWLYNRFPEMEEGDLTQMRSALVQTNQLAAFARLLKFENTIRLGKGETKSGGKLRNTLLCDVFEAFIGSLFLDKGIEVVKEFMKPLLEVAIEEVIEQHKNEDPKSQLQEWAQANGYSTPKYLTRNVHGPDHAKVFEIEVRVNSKVMGEGIGKSKQAAEKSAAQKALESINQH